MRKIQSSLQKMQIPDWGIPVGLLGVCLLAYGLLISRLGYYQDEWHFIYYAYTRGAAGLTELLNFDGHPLAAPLYIASFYLLGFAPINWQIYSLFWRWLAVVAFWLVLNRTWPGHRRVTFTAAAIYAIYPLYAMQPMAIVYFEVWISHFLLAVSFLFTIEAIKQPRRFWLFTILALLIKILHTFSSEYTWGTEFARIVLIWLALSHTENENIRRRLAKTLRIYAPYLAILLPAIIWRGFLYQSPVLARSTPYLLDQILADPLNGIWSLIHNSIPDIALMLFSTWFKTFSPDYFLFSNTINLQILGLTVLSVMLLTVFLTQLDNSLEIVKEAHDHWLLETFALGVTILIFGLMPSYAAGYFIAQKIEPWNGRFVIGSMPGVALLNAILIEKVLTVPRTRILLAAIVISLGIGWQVRVSNKFRWAWNAEINFYSQLLLRAPDISPNTAIISDKEFLGLMGGYPTSFAINTLYATPPLSSGLATSSSRGNESAKTWLFLIDSDFNGRPEALKSNAVLYQAGLSTRFTGNSSNSLVIYFEPDYGQCLWLITPEIAPTVIMPRSLQIISPLTNTHSIEADATPPQFLQSILRNQPENWCSFYQRGSLAAQTGDWKTVVKLWEQAKDKDLRPANGLEFIPFIEAYARLGNWDQALDLTKWSLKISKGMNNILCMTWDRSGQASAPSDDKEKAFSTLKTFLECR